MSDLLPDSIEDEATQNKDGDYEMTEIHETTFDLKLKSDGICRNSDELVGIYPPAKLNFSGQDNQVVLGIREKSVQAFWSDQNGVRKPVKNHQDPQPEYVNVHVKDDIVEIKFTFDCPEEAVYHFEFTFKSGISIDFMLNSQLFTVKLWAYTPVSNKKKITWFFHNFHAFFSARKVTVNPIWLFL